MVTEGPRPGPAAGAPGPPDDPVTVVREILAVVPAGCSWLLPEADEAGRVTDFRIAAVSGLESDVLGRGQSRVGALITELYPSIVEGPLWQLYLEVLATGDPGELRGFTY